MCQLEFTHTEYIFAKFFVLLLKSTLRLRSFWQFFIDWDGFRWDGQQDQDFPISGKKIINSLSDVTWQGTSTSLHPANLNLTKAWPRVLQLWSRKPENCQLSFCALEISGRLFPIWCQEILHFIVQQSMLSWAFSRFSWSELCSVLFMNVKKLTKVSQTTWRNKITSFTAGHCLAGKMINYK